MQGLARPLQGFGLLLRGNKEPIQHLSRRIKCYNLPFKRSTLASVLRIDCKRGPSGGCYNIPGKKQQWQDSHTWKEGQELCLKHSRFDMTIRCLRGNIKSAFESMKAKFRTEV